MDKRAVIFFPAGNTARACVRRPVLLSGAAFYDTLNGRLKGALAASP
jgi:hypothetical protein